MKHKESFHYSPSEDDHNRKKKCRVVYKGDDHGFNIFSPSQSTSKQTIETPMDMKTKPTIFISMDIIQKLFLIASQLYPFNHQYMK